MTGSPNDHGLFVLGAKGRNGGRCLLGAEINNEIAAPNPRLKIIPLIDLTDNLQVRMLRNAGNQRATHAAFETRDDDVCHVTLEARTFSVSCGACPSSSRSTGTRAPDIPP